MNPEIALYWDMLKESVDEIMASLGGLSDEELNWQPTLEANSLYVLATHTMGNIEEMIGRILCGGGGERDRPAEFAASGNSAEPLVAAWQEQRARLDQELTMLPADVLTGTYVYGRLGEISGRKLIFLCARHANEHRGHAELTRQLLDARG